MGFSQGLNSGTNIHNARLNKRRLEQDVSKQKAQDRLNQQTQFNTVLANHMTEAEKLIATALENNNLDNPQIQSSIDAFVAPAIDVAERAREQGIQLSFTPEQIQGKINALRLGKTGQQSLEAENEQLRAKETIKAEVKQEFAAPKKPTELELFAQLSTQQGALTPEQEVMKKALTEKFSPKDKQGNSIASRTVTVDTPEGPVVHGVDTKNGTLVPMQTPDGNPAINEAARRQRSAQNRLDRKETRLVLKDLDKQYKDFAHKNRIFLDQANAYNALVNSGETLDQSVEDKVLTMTFLRRLKPTGTISSNFDLASADELKNVPEAILSGIKGFFKTGKITSPRVRSAMVSYVTKEYQIAKQREESVIKNAKSRAEELGQAWTPPIFIPGSEGIVEVKDEDLESFDSDQKNFEDISDEDLIRELGIE